MKLSDMKRGDVVLDAWYSDPEYQQYWGKGTITSVLKTVVYVHFKLLGKEVKYDKPHATKYLSLSK